MRAAAERPASSMRRAGACASARVPAGPSSVAAGASSTCRAGRGRAGVVRQAPWSARRRTRRSVGSRRRPRGRAIVGVRRGGRRRVGLVCVSCWSTGSGFRFCRRFVGCRVVVAAADQAARGADLGDQIGDGEPTVGVASGLVGRRLQWARRARRFEGWPASLDHRWATATAWTWVRESLPRRGASRSGGGPVSHVAPMARSGDRRHVAVTHVLPASEL